MNTDESPQPGGKHLQLLLGSLAEYAAKLKSAYNEWTALKWRLALTILVSLAILTVVGFVFAILDTARLDISERRVAGSLLTILLLILAFGVVSFVLSIRRRARLKRSEVEILAEQVARLIRLASQFEQHGKVEDFSEKMLLDLRLAEAEASLRYSRELQRDSLSNLLLS